MKTIDFKHFRVWRDLGADTPVELDVRREVSNYLLSSLGGVEGMDLALAIFRAEEPLELDDERFERLRRTMARPMEQGGVAAFMYLSLLRNAGVEAEPEKMEAK